MSEENPVNNGGGPAMKTVPTVRLPKLSLKELGALEAEVALALSIPSLPEEKRTELERRLAAVRAKIEVETAA